MSSARQESIAKALLAETGGDVTAAITLLKKVKQAKKPSYTPKHKTVIAAVEGLTKSYKVGGSKVEALKAVDLNIHQGEFVAITGTSGSGKSTLLQLIGGLDKPDSGSVTILEQNIAQMSDKKLSHFRNKTIGFVFQFFYLQPFLDLQNNIEVPAMFARTPRASRHERSQALAKTVGLHERIKHLPRELSGGQMQRAAIARALQNSPSILLADEPTGNLDRANALAIFDLFRDICDNQGTTVVVVTHDLGLAAMADRMIEMQDGAIV